MILWLLLQCTTIGCVIYVWVWEISTKKFKHNENIPDAIVSCIIRTIGTDFDLLNIEILCIMANHQKHEIRLIMLHKLPMLWCLEKWFCVTNIHYDMVILHYRKNFILPCYFNFISNLIENCTKNSRIFPKFQ